MAASKESQIDPHTHFLTTHWSVVLAAAHTESPERQVALTALCQSYWYPLYAFARRQGRNPQEAEDLTQQFFAQLLAKHGLASVRPEHGRFRSFLLASLKNFLANDWDWNHTAKRGGDCAIVSLDDQASEERYLREPTHDATPEKLFEQSWALTLIASVLKQLRKDYADAGKGHIFEAIHSYLEEDGAQTYAEMAATLNMTEGAVKMAVLRLRENFRHRLRSEIAQTVGSAGEIDEELRHLFTCLGR
ncbi:MAG TPA: sigma-70 family RNA polymerase sigma factor [Verrucomicrobiae bacterium]|nr:sigma-70 family RNA polymerase sigma factor [Verrucomicrobiae bacterium]